MAQAQRLAADLVLHVIGQPRGALADGAVVDGVGADGVHLAAPPAGAEGDRRPEGVVQFLPAAGGEVLGHRRGILGQIGLGEPDADVARGPGRELPLGRGRFQLCQGAVRVHDRCHSIE